MSIWRWMKSACFFGASTIAFSLCAIGVCEEESAQWVDCRNGKIWERPYSMGRSARAKKSPCVPQRWSPLGVKLYGEYLYWQVVQDQLHYAALLSEVTPPLPTSENIPQVKGHLRVVDPRFAYRSGFRVGAHYAPPSTKWNVTFSWTDLHRNGSSWLSDPNQGILPTSVPLVLVIDPPGPELLYCTKFAELAISYWRFEMNVADLQWSFVYHAYQLGCKPFLGIKFGSIRQRQSIQYANYKILGFPADVRNDKKNNWTGAGPSLGLDLSWDVSAHCNLVAGVTGALMYGRIHAWEKPVAATYVSDTMLRAPALNKSKVRPMFATNIGMSWRTLQLRRPILFGVGYEFQYWWNQWQVPSSFIGSALTEGVAPNGDLMMHGWTIQVGIVF